MPSLLFLKNKRETEWEMILWNYFTGLFIYEAQKFFGYELKNFFGYELKNFLAKDGKFFG